MADILLGNVKGPQGNTGATGSQGPRGDAATITVGTVSTTAYGNTASVTNSGTAQDAVLDFVIPQGKPGEQTTRMGALTLDTITAQSANFPIPAVGETGSTVFGKIIKFFNSTISALNSKLNISDVVNNLTSTSTTQPLSAAQGKALNDAYTTLNSAMRTVYSGSITSSVTGATPGISTIVRAGKQISFCLFFASTSFNSTSGIEIAVGNVPADFRPLGNRYVMGYIAMNGTRIPTYFVIKTNGNVSFVGYANGTVQGLGVAGSYLYGD